MRVRRAAEQLIAVWEQIVPSGGPDVPMVGLTIVDWEALSTAIERLNKALAP
jgi:hypothetical protein